MNASEIDLPGLKDLLWHKMRDDLIKFIPAMSDNELLMCPACGRFLPHHDFSIEHILPQQALADDPVEIKASLSVNKRAGVTLLCQKPLIIKGSRVHGGGCNSWKGKHYDRCMRELFSRKIFEKNSKVSIQNNIAVFNTGFLALFNEYGYQIPLSAAGLLMRHQFFRPYSFGSAVPLMCQVILLSQEKPTLADTIPSFWEKPFAFAFENGKCIFITRAVSTYLPLSRDPRITITRTLPFAPPKHVLRVNYGTIFD